MITARTWRPPRASFPAYSEVPCGLRQRRSLRNATHSMLMSRLRSKFGDQGMHVIRAAATIATTCALLVVAGVPAPALERSDFVGIWLSEKRDGAMELRPCGEMLCGYIHSI